MERPVTYRLDARKVTIAVALAEVGKRGNAREYATVASTLAAVKTLAANLLLAVVRCGSATKLDTRGCGRVPCDGCVVASNTSGLSARKSNEKRMR